MNIRKIRVIDNPPSMYYAYRYRGLEIDAIRKRESSTDSGWYVLVDGNQTGEAIMEAHAEELPSVEAKSGMTYIRVDGNMGLLVQTDKGLHCTCPEKGSHTEYSEDLLTTDLDYGIVSLFQGMNVHGHYGNPVYFPSSANKAYLVWERPSKKISVKLNDEYTATVEGDNVIVGCQTIPVEKLRELLKAIDGE